MTALKVFVAGYIFKLFRTLKQPKTGSWFIWTSRWVASRVLNVNYFIFRVPTGISPKSIYDTSDTNVFYVDVVVIYKKLTSADASG